MAKRTRPVRGLSALNAAAGTILDQIAVMDGLEPLHEHLTRLEWIRHRLYGWSEPGLFPNRHLLVSMNRGDGRSTLLSWLHAYLRDARVFPNGPRSQETAWAMREHVFSAPVSTLIPEDMPNRDVEDELRFFQGGVVGLHIDDWPGRLDAQAFRRLLRWCRERKDSLLFVFFVPVLEPAVLERLRRTLSEQVPVRLLPFRPSTDEQLVRLAAGHFTSMGFEWEAAADSRFRQRLLRERNDGRFYGRRTCMKLVTELLLDKARHAVLAPEPTPFGRITARDFDRPWLQNGPAPTPGAPAGWEQLDALIGLEPVKRRLQEIVASMRILHAHGDATSTPIKPPCNHMLFTGAPGTGKTEVARILGRIFRDEGLLPVGDLIEANRFTLVGQCIGQTGPRTLEACRSAYGSLLFVDDAWLLATPQNGSDSRDFGQEALGALIGEMENRRDRFIVILSGYSDRMEALFELNPGLRDRLPHRIDFPGYSRHDLFGIFLSTARRTCDVEPDLAERVRAWLDDLPDGVLSAPDFGNARFIQNLSERIRMRALMRAGESDAWRTPGKDDRMILTVADFEHALAEDGFASLHRVRMRPRIGY